MKHFDLSNYSRAQLDEVLKSPYDYLTSLKSLQLKQFEIIECQEKIVDTCGKNIDLNQELITIVELLFKVQSMISDQYVAYQNEFLVHCDLSASFGKIKHLDFLEEKLISQEKSIQTEVSSKNDSNMVALLKFNFEEVNLIKEVAHYPLKQ
eukprot:NODE_81_length_22758_cov_0.877797.p15 type:complete len:151 gc:universal NODE_81_length_22758_cov_0.877797:7254-7706(+)